jgi:hypothetical protein
MHSHEKPWLTAGGIAAAVMSLLAAGSAHADYLVSNDISFSYTGTVTAPSGATYAIPTYTYNGTTYSGRDASIWASSNAPTALTGDNTYANWTQFGTSWYPSTVPASGYGWGNPNNTDTGFVQFVDFTNAAVTSASGMWDQALTTFVLSITGGSLANNNTRLWDAPNVGGAASDTGGTLLSYALTITAIFASPATEDIDVPGWYESLSMPVSITGSFTGTFSNTSSNTDLNGTYSFNLTFQYQNWASDVGAAFTSPSYFGSDDIPEPTTMALFGFGLLGLAAARRRHA